MPLEGMWPHAIAKSPATVADVSEQHSHLERVRRRGPRHGFNAETTAIAAFLASYGPAKPWPYPM